MVRFVYNSRNFLGRLTNSQDIYMGVFNKGTFDFKNLGQTDDSKFYLSHDENYVIINKNNQTIC